MKKALVNSIVYFLVAVVSLISIVFNSMTLLSGGAIEGSVFQFILFLVVFLIMFGISVFFTVVWFIRFLQIKKL